LFVFALAFLILPAFVLFAGSVRDSAGNLTLANVAGLWQPTILDAYWRSIRLSLVTAIGGAVVGFPLAYAAVLGHLPRFVRSTLLTFSGVAATFAGVPLAFAFIATLGRAGLVTVLLNALFGVNIYDQGFNLYSFWGLSLIYLYCQAPLMILMIAPALDGLLPEWREASENLGASGWHYWRYVALPILFPSLLGAMIVLFGNAFGAYSTAYALTGGAINLAPILVGAQIRGDVLNTPNQGYALALGMISIMALSIALYSQIQRRTAHWLRQ
jgi:putative spermidine/putrescine transport system permease protein